jgi:hypothetical protein
LFDLCNLVDSARPHSLQMCDARADVIKSFCGRNLRMFIVS